MVRAGMEAARLVLEPREWINRRVETIELLSHEETRRRVSIDFTLDEAEQSNLLTAHGIVVPISLLAKAPRRNFDLRGESGQAVPVLGREQNQELAQIALLSAALDALPQPVEDELVDHIAGDVGRVVASDARDARRALEHLAWLAQDGRRDPVWQAIWADPDRQLLFEELAFNYVLFAVVPPGGAARRILKYSYSEEFPRDRGPRRFRDRVDVLRQSVKRPGRTPFEIHYPMGQRAASFHVELAVPEELRIELALLYDLERDDQVSPTEWLVDRASLYAIRELTPESDVMAYAVVTPERSGVTFQGAATGVVVAALLWLGTLSDLDVENPGAAVSLLLAAAAFFSGVAALRGEHPLVRRVFASTRRRLAVISISALAASSSIAMKVPDAQPVEVWLVAAIVATLAALMLLWAAIRAPA